MEEPTAERSIREGFTDGVRGESTYPRIGGPSRSTSPRKGGPAIHLP